MSDNYDNAKSCASDTGADEQYLMQWFKVLLAATIMTAAAIFYLVASHGGIAQ